MNKRNSALTADEIKEFKVLFSKFCRGEINNGRCDDDACQFCSVNTAYDDIFSELNRGEFDVDD